MPSKIPDILYRFTGNSKVHHVKADDLQSIIFETRLGNQALGYLVEFTVNPSSSNDDKAQTLTAFATTAEDTERIQKLVLWTDQGRLP